LRRGVRIAVDVGDVRIGVAASDPHGLIATPVETVPTGKRDLARILEIVAEYEAVEVIVGLPRSLSGKEGAAAAKARTFADRLVRVLDPAIGVRLVDERLTTVTATRGLQASGVKAKKARGVIDQAAAIVILQSALEIERGSGRLPGQAVQSPTTGPVSDSERPTA
jgi:putative holliday junction resolvase